MAGEAADLHTPVLLAETLEFLAVTNGDYVCDCTCGLGGHTEALLRVGARVDGIDRDPRARALASERLHSFSDQFTSIPGSYSTHLADAAARGQRYDAVLADLGVSSLQLDDDDRGFGIRSEQPIDMRMADGGETALELIDRLSAEELADIIYLYGEERRSRPIARALKEARGRGIESGQAFAEVIRSVVRGHQQRHPAIRTFQALRIAVNDELGEVERLLALLPQVLNDGGRAVIISFHSLEDRLVKNDFRERRRAGEYADAARKVVTATATEKAQNRRSGPAKLRWARRAPRSEVQVCD